jgi:RHS repeat-associated protein
VAIDSASLAVTRRYYDPNGNPVGAPPSSWPGTRGFVGGTADTATGLTSLGAREYNPGTASSSTPIPSSPPYDPQDLNPYAYAADNPATNSDPSGLVDGPGTGPNPCAVDQLNWSSAMDARSTRRHSSGLPDEAASSRCLSVAIEEAHVLRAVFDWAVTLTIGSPKGAEFYVRIEQPFILLGPDGKEALLVPDGDPARLAPVLGVLRRSVIRIDAFKDGHLELEFAGAYSLSVPACEDYEPWEISGPRGARLVSVPGGSVSVWEGTAT